MCLKFFFIYWKVNCRQTLHPYSNTSASTPENKNVFLNKNTTIKSEKFNIDTIVHNSYSPLKKSCLSQLSYSAFVTSSLASFSLDQFTIYFVFYNTEFLPVLSVILCLSVLWIVFSWLDSGSAFFPSWEYCWRAVNFMTSPLKGHDFRWSQYYFFSLPTWLILCKYINLKNIDFPF